MLRIIKTLAGLCLGSSSCEGVAHWLHTLAHTHTQSHKRGDHTKSMIKFAILCAMATTVRCSAATALASMLDNLETKAQELARKIEEQTRIELL